MDINLLVQRLRHGDTYTVQDGENDPYQSTRPPNHLMIKAAAVILHQDAMLKQNNETMFLLQQQLNELTQQYETLRNTSTTTTPS